MSLILSMTVASWAMTAYHVTQFNRAETRAAIDKHGSSSCFFLLLSTFATAKTVLAVMQ